MYVCVYISISIHTYFLYSLFDFFQRLPHLTSFRGFFIWFSLFFIWLLSEASSFDFFQRLLYLTLYIQQFNLKLNRYLPERPLQRPALSRPPRAIGSYIYIYIHMIYAQLCIYIYIHTYIYIYIYTYTFNPHLSNNETIRQAHDQQVIQYTNDTIASLNMLLLISLLFLFLLVVVLLWLSFWSINIIFICPDGSFRTGRNESARQGPHMIWYNTI